MFELPQRALNVAEQVEHFFQQRVLPNNKLWEQHPRRTGHTEIQQTLRKEAKALVCGIWHCLGLLQTNRVCACPIWNHGGCRNFGAWKALHVFNCNAPDVPNMELAAVWQRRAKAAVAATLAGG